MRTFERIIFALMLGAAPFAAPAFGFDGAPAANQDTAIPVVSPQPGAVTHPGGAHEKQCYADI